MTTIYKPLAIGATPTLNTSGNAVRTLQTQLNTQNQGVAGYVPLKVDGLYGKLTQAATQFKAPVTTAGTSKYGGNGGAGANGTSGIDGTVPGGGGGGTHTGTTSGAGAGGKVIITTFF